jgi:hypothetical protein
MKMDEVVTLITWINQHDPRVQINKPTREVWTHSLADPITFDDAKQAVLEHYRANDSEVANPGTIRKRALAIRSFHKAKESAEYVLEAPKPVRHPLSWRSRNPELWDQLFEQGRAEGNAIRQRATDAREGRAA